MAHLRAAVNKLMEKVQPVWENFLLVNHQQSESEAQCKNNSKKEKTVFCVANKAIQI